ncbi:DUF4129 domain-containing transglutaminase family protein [Paenibacillus sp. NPDC058071]|uniref:DUF4129 domain-containing transglutaminase family protein n=1 Tax=Paenibacillus sp. NPDC058071 TaxID=3346326 RepID=UPI0036DB4475
MITLWKGLKWAGRLIAPSWYPKLTRMLVGLMLIQTIAIFENFWWDETYTIAYATLSWAIVIDLVLPLKVKLWRLLLQAAVAVITVFRYVEMEGYSTFEPVTWQTRIDWIVHYAVQMHPFIWIAGGLLVLHVLFGSWITTRPRLIGFVAGNLAALTIADSFTPIWLWDEVAWIVFLGLLWLVAAHLHRLERDHPRSWQEMLEYPLQLIVPVSVVLTVLMTAGLLMPTVSPILQDPYTLWKEAKGERVNVFLGDKGLNEPTQVSTGDTSSGYGRNDTALGGGFNYDFSPVMTVQSSHRSYWRGESKSIYTGQGWESDTREDLVSTVAKNRPFGVQFERDLAETTTIEQTFTMLREEKYPVLFAASPPTMLAWVNNPDLSLSTNVYWHNQTGELRWAAGGERYPNAYGVQSEVTVLDEEGLRKTHAGWGTEFDPRKTSSYLELPDELPGRVKQLAADLTKGAENDYDRAKLIEAYLSTTFPYTNKPDLTKLTGQSTDFVDQFLFELKEGYCDYFSTAMAVMARSVNLPTRWVKGFTPGYLPATNYGPGYSDLSEFELNPDGKGTYTVRNADAHSWVEIYFDGYGWIPFEPTSGFSFPYRFPTEAIQAPTDYDFDLGDAGAAEAEGTKDRMWTIGFWSSISLLVASAIAWAIVRRRSIAATWSKIRFRSYTADERIVWETERLLRKCKRKGFERAEHETLREAVARWAQSRKLLQQPLRELLDGFERAKYSPAQATNDDADVFQAKAKQLIRLL